MANMTILEAAEHFGVSKEAIHNRVRRGSLVVTLVDGIKMVDVDQNAKKATPAKPRAPRKAAVASDDRYYKLLEDQNAHLQVKVEKLEGETRSLRDQKEDMLIQERIKIEQIYKDKDEQLKNILTTLSSQFMLNAPLTTTQEEHLDAEIEIETEKPKQKIIKPKSKVKKVLPQSKNEKEKGELISLKKYLKKHNFADKKKEKIKARFIDKAKEDERIIVLGSKFYLDTIKYDYRDLIK